MFSKLKKIMKCFCCFTLLISGLCVYPINVKANDQNDNCNNEECEILVIDGKEYQYSNNLSNDDVEELEYIISEYGLNPQGVVVGVKSVVTKIDEQTTSNGMTPYTLGSDKMVISMVVTRIDDSGYDHFQIGAVAAWNPDYTYHTNVLADDKFAVSWNHDFALVSETHTAYYSSLYGGSSTLYELQNRILRGKTVAGKGVSWSVPYVTSYGGSTFKLNYPMVYVNIKKLNSSGVFNVVVEYAASTTTTSVTVGITDASVTFTGAHEPAQPAFKAITY